MNRPPDGRARWFIIQQEQEWWAELPLPEHEFDGIPYEYKEMLRSHEKQAISVCLEELSWAIQKFQFKSHFAKQFTLWNKDYLEAAASLSVSSITSPLPLHVTELLKKIYTRSIGRKFEAMEIWYYMVFLDRSHGATIGDVTKDMEQAAQRSVGCLLMVALGFGIAMLL